MKLSVIVPIYNVEKYLFAALQSLSSQDHSDLEIILVNDGSTDNSLTIINEFIEKDSRFSVVNQENYGYGRACNVGMANATGEYITFFEPDDILSVSFYERLMRAAVQSNADIVRCNGFYSYDEAPQQKLDSVKSYLCECIHSRDAIPELWIKHPAIWNAVYRRNFIEENNIQFCETEGASYQDAQFLVSLYYSCQKIFIVNFAGYYYRSHAGQSIAVPDSKINSVIKNWTIEYNWLRAKQVKDFSYFLLNCFSQFYSLYCNRMLKRRNKRKLLSAIRQLKVQVEQRNVSFQGFHRDIYFLYRNVSFFILLNFLLWLFNTINRIVIPKKSFFKFYERVTRILNCRMLFSTVQSLEFEKYLSNRSNEPLPISINTLWSNFLNQPQEVGIRLLSCAPLSILLHKANITSTILPDSQNVIADADLLIQWGQFRTTQTYEMIHTHALKKIPIVLMEEGLIRSITPNQDATYGYHYQIPISFCADLKTTYYDAVHSSMLEDLLNSNRKLTQKESIRAQNNIRKIVDNHISKFNYQPIVTPKIGKKKKKVLVVDQTYNDWSILKGYASETTFAKMLHCAISENPDADIIIKVHPDTIIGNREGSGYYSHITPTDHIHIIRDSVDPISLIKYVDKVYVCTSQMGFEALLCNKETIIFGIPFYAGWGLGDCRNNGDALTRRVKQRSIEEIFYFLYVEYTRYINPKTCRSCDIEEAIAYILAKRSEYFASINMA